MLDRPVRERGVEAGFLSSGDADALDLHAAHASSITTVREPDVMTCLPVGCAAAQNKQPPVLGAAQLAIRAEAPSDDQPGTTARSTARRR
jgi:hypothetical protein